MADQFNHFEELAQALETASQQVVKKTAFDTQANIQARIQGNGQIDTGFMFNSVYTQTMDGSTYAGGEHALPEADAPEDNKTAHVAVAAEYAPPQNYGTKYLPARPFFEPGFEDTKDSFDAAMALIQQAWQKVSEL